MRAQPWPGLSSFPEPLLKYIFYVAQGLTSWLKALSPWHWCPGWEALRHHGRHWVDHSGSDIMVGLSGSQTSWVNSSIYGLMAEWVLKERLYTTKYEVFLGFLDARRYTALSHHTLLLWCVASDTGLEASRLGGHATKLRKPWSQINHSFLFLHSFG